MDEWVITDPKATMIYGTVEAEDVNDASSAVDSGRARWFWQGKPDPHAQLSVHPVATLADGRWREAAPGTALPHGDCGGDFQISDAYGRQFWLALPEGGWAMLGLSWYLSDDTGYVDEPGEGRCLYRQEEYALVGDIYEPGLSETWAESRYLIEGDFPTTEAGVLQAVADFAPAAEISWNGKAFR